MCAAKKKIDKSKSTLPKSLEAVNLNAAGIDIGSTEHFVAVPEDRCENPVRMFGCYTPDLHRMAQWLHECGIDTVVLESTGVYWIPAFDILERSGFEVLLVDRRQANSIPGRKSDVEDLVFRNAEKGIYCATTPIGITNNTISDNAYGIYCEQDATPTIANNIVTYNSVGIQLNGGATSPVLSHNCVFENTSSNYSGIAAGASDIQKNPLFVNRAANDYHISAGSPCVNWGDDSYVTGGMTDIDGNPRIIGSHVDIGADERQAGTVFSTTGGFVKGNVKWNLISIPADPDDADPLSVLAGIDVPNANLQFWKIDGDEGYQIYGSIWGWTGPMTRGTAYWFMDPAATQNVDITFTGVAPSSDFEFTLSAHSRAPFWIMFGTPFPSAVLADNVRFKNVSKRGDTWLTWEQAYSESDADLRIVESSAQGWDTAGQGFVSVTTSTWAGTTHQFEPWWGFWMMIHDVGELKIKFPKP